MSSHRVRRSKESVMASLPAPGEVMFKANPSDIDAPTVDVEGTWTEYARQYEHAAHQLLKLSSEGDVTIYPAIFLFRHYLELQLKAIAALGIVIEHVQEEKIEAKKTAAAMLNDHNLERLTTRCMEVCKRTGLLENHEFALAFDAFEGCVREISSLDPASFTFRYPIDKQLNPVLAQGFQVDLENLDLVMAKMSFLLRSVWVAADIASRNVGQYEYDYDWTDEDERLYRKDILGLDEIEADQDTDES